MDPILANVMKVQGVAAAAIFGPGNDCLAFAASEPIFEPIMLLAAIHAAEENLDIFRTVDKLGDASSFTCELEHGYFLYRQSGGARLGVMAMTGVNVAMLDVVVGVAALKLAQAEPQRASVPVHAVDYAPAYAGAAHRATGTMASQPPPIPGPGSGRYSAVFPVPPTVPTTRTVATGSQSVAQPPPGSGSGLSSMAGGEEWHPDELLNGGVQIPGTVGSSVMQHVLRALSRFLSGHAKAVIVEELARLGATPATVRAPIFTDFIYNLAERIPDPGVHDEFIKVALGDRR